MNDNDVMTQPWNADVPNSVLSRGQAVFRVSQKTAACLRVTAPQEDPGDTARGCDRAAWEESWIGVPALQLACCGT